MSDDPVGLYQDLKKAVDEGTISVRDLAKVVGEDSVAAFIDARDLSDDLTEHHTLAVARLTGVWEGFFDFLGDGWDSVQIQALETLGNIVIGYDRFQAEFSELLGKIPGNIFGDGGDTFEDLFGYKLEDVSITGGGGAQGPATPGGRAGAQNSIDAYIQGLNSTIHRALTSGDPTTAVQTGPRGSTQNSIDAFIQDLNRSVHRGLTSGYTFDPGGGAGGGGGGGTGGGGGPAARDLGPQSASAFTRATAEANERAFSNAIANNDFSLAEDIAGAIFSFAATNAAQLETAGEQFLAQQTAAFNLEDNLGTVTDAINATAVQSVRALTTATAEANERAFSNAIADNDFTLAEDIAESIFSLAITSAAQLETAGEQFLAQQTAAFKLEDSLTNIASAQEQLADTRATAQLAELRRQSEYLQEANRLALAETLEIDNLQDSVLARTSEGFGAGLQDLQALRDAQLGHAAGQFDRGEINRTQFDALRAGANARFDEDAQGLRDQFGGDFGNFLPQPEPPQQSNRPPARASSTQQGGGDIYITISESTDDRGNRVRFIESAVQDGVNAGRILLDA